MSVTTVTEELRPVWVAMQPRRLNCNPIGIYSVVVRSHSDTDNLYYYRAIFRLSKSQMVGI